MKYLLPLLLLCGCIDTSKLEVRRRDTGLRFLGCDFMVTQVADGVYVVKWKCS